MGAIKKVYFSIASKEVVSPKANNVIGKDVCTLLVDGKKRIRDYMAKTTTHSLVYSMSADEFTYLLESAHYQILRAGVRAYGHWMVMRTSVRRAMKDGSLRDLVRDRTPDATDADTTDSEGEPARATAVAPGGAGGGAPDVLLSPVLGFGDADYASGEAEGDRPATRRPPPQAAAAGAGVAGPRAAATLRPLEAAPTKAKARESRAQRRASRKHAKALETRIARVEEELKAHGNKLDMILTHLIRRGAAGGAR